jgi:hypothetical protein
MALAKKLIGILTGSFVLAAAPLTRATDYDWNKWQDQTSFNGSSCSFSDPNATTGQDRSSGKLLNSSGSTQWTICPISRIRWIPNILAASIQTTPGVQASQCKLKVRRWSDGTFQSLNYSDVQNIGGNTQIRFMFSTPFEVDGDTSLAIACPLPSGQSIFTYLFDSEDRYTAEGL